MKLGPPMGVVDIGVSNRAYLCRVSLPGLRNKDNDLSIEIRRDSRVNVRGAVHAHKLSNDSPADFQTTVQELNPPGGQFTIFFSLPGPVDTRVMSPQFRADRILEIVVYKAVCRSSV